MLGRSNTGGGGVGGVLTVTAPAGVTVEVSKDGKIKRKTANAEGLAVFKGLATGTWTLTITKGSQTSTKPVVITADYSATISFFAASINVTYPAGSTCTCTDGTTTMTAPDTSGTWVCVVPNAGTWTVTCTNGTSTAKRELSITTDGQSEVVEMDYILYLYNAGNEFTDITGGLKAYAIAYASSGSYSENMAPVITRNTSSITIKHNSSYTDKSGAVRFTNKINVSKYRTLKFDGTLSGSRASIYIWKSIGNYYGQNYAAYKTGSASGEISLDIPADSGECYIGFGIDHTQSITIKKMWLEG